MVHAGLLPGWDVAQAKRLSDEVSVALTAPDYTEFLANMWGSEPDGWRDDLTGWDRLRVAVNAMTRMRFVTADGRMEFRATGAEGPRNAGRPTACHGSKPRAARAPITARSAVTGLPWGFRQTENLLALDTGCLWGGRLTAIRLENQSGVPDAVRSVGKADRMAIRHRTPCGEFHPTGARSPLRR